MKNHILQKIIIFLSILFILALPAAALDNPKDMAHPGQTSESQMDQPAMDKMAQPAESQMEHPAGSQTDHAGHVGKRIHESTVDGYTMAWHLLDLPGRDVQHLMVYIVAPDGKPVTDARVGYLVVGPDGVSQKVMAMSMNEAHGGDVNMNLAGKYTIKVKAVIQDVKLIDEFEFEVENHPQ